MEHNGPANLFICFKNFFFFVKLNFVQTFSWQFDSDVVFLKQTNSWQSTLTREPRTIFKKTRVSMLSPPHAACCSISNLQKAQLVKVFWLLFIVTVRTPQYLKIRLTGFYKFWCIFIDEFQSSQEKTEF